MCADGRERGRAVVSVGGSFQLSNLGGGRYSRGDLELFFLDPVGIIVFKVDIGV